MSAAIQPITGADAQTGGASVNDEGTAQRDRAPRRPSKLLTKDGSASYFEGEEAEVGAQGAGFQEAARDGGWVSDHVPCPRMAHHSTRRSEATKRGAGVV